MKASRYLTLGAGVLVMSSALALDPITYPDGVNYPSAEGIQPTAYPGNFVADTDDEVCYAMIEAGLIDDPAGKELVGFKVDPPVDYDDGCISTTLSTDGKELAWEACEGSDVLAFIIKGGPNFNLYDYSSSTLMADSKLHSPPIAKTQRGVTTYSIPQISHYNGCYVPPDEFQGEGCTPGYWRNHYDRWSGYTADQYFDEVFGVEYLPNVTLGMAIDNPNVYGTFAFHAVAALLNSTGGVPNEGDGATVNYPLSAAQVIQAVQGAVADDTTDDTKDLLAGYNEAGCPLSGTPACGKKNPDACLP